jgi:hypothetical protein
MILKRPLDARRLRAALPPSFGWLDHRLLREGYLQRCHPPAWALYCLLVCASDAQGLSFYSEARLAQLLGLTPAELWQARRELLAAQLIAFAQPLYQVLALGGEAPPPLSRWQPALQTVADTAPPPKPRPPGANAPVTETAAPEGLDLRAMVQASLREGGAQ